MDTNKRDMKRIINGITFHRYDTVLITCGSKRAKGILQDCDSTDYIWARIIKSCKISELLNWKYYPHIEFPYVNDEQYPVTIMHDKCVLIEKIIVDSYNQGFENHVDNIVAYTLGG